MNRDRCAVHALSIAVLAVAAPAIADAGPGSDGAWFQGIGYLPGGQHSSYALGVSGDGSVVIAGAYDADNKSEAARWTLKGGLEGIGFLPASRSVLLSSDASAISADGSTIVGYGPVDNGKFPQGTTMAFRWTLAGGFVELGVLAGPDGSYSTARGVSADGSVVVGDSHDASLPPSFVNAVRWSAGGISDLGLLPGYDNGFASAVSGDGSVIVGTCGTSDGTSSEAFRWTAAGMVGLGFLPNGAASSAAIAISRDGSAIVGYEVVHNGEAFDIEAFRWTESEGKIGLGYLPAPLNYSYAYAASADGKVIVGAGYDGTPVPFIWDAEHGMRNIQTVLEEQGADLAGWHLFRASGVSDDGRTIVGLGVNPQGEGEGWVAHLADVDSDGDGLLDDWEANGIPYVDSQGAGHRYMLPGADKNRKDLYIEIDAMDGPGLAPAATQLAPVVAAFNSSPVGNPDGSTGVNLHLQLDEMNLPTIDFPNDFADFDLVKQTHFGTQAEANDPEAAAILGAKRQAYRYCIFGKSQGAGSSSGKSEIGGNDFMVTLGRWSIPGGTADEKAGTFMHELGHALGLGHGGRDPAGGPDHVLYKPNYYSIMNYTWQTPADWMAPGTWPLSPGRSGYSAAAMADLDESALIECQGMGFPSGFSLALTIHNTHDSTTSPPSMAASRMGGGIDWNNDGHQDCLGQPVSVDLNHVNAGDDPSPGQTLIGREDWSQLVYDFRDSPDYADGRHVTVRGLPPELTVEERDAVADSLPAFCAGDIDLSRSVDIDDLFEVINHWGLCADVDDCTQDIAPIGSGDHVVDVDDLFEVINHWGACP